MPAAAVDFSVRDENMLRFLRDTQQNYYREMYEHLREIGVKTPITGNNSYMGRVELSASEICDFRDNHLYWDMWGDTKSENGNRVMLEQEQPFWASQCASNRLLDRPFVISEWDQVWPNEWRAESVIMLAALAAFQAWSGIIIHTYRYRSSGPIDRLGAVVMYGKGSRVNFDTFNDPAKFGLFYHAALLYRRGHIAPAKQTTGLQLTENDIFSPETKPLPALANLSEQHKSGVILPGQSFKLDILLHAGDTPAALEDNILSDTGELCRNPKGRFAWVDTAQTKAVYGFLGSQPEIAIKGLTLQVKTAFAVIAISALDDEPIDKSANLLLTAVGRADNSNARYNDDHTERFDVGTAPTLIEVIEADIEMKTSQSHLRIFAIDAEGFIKSHANVRIEDGTAKFNIGSGRYPSMYYLIQSIG